MRWLESITNSMDMNFSKLKKTIEDREAWQAAVHGVVKSLTQLSDQTRIYMSKCGSVCVYICVCAYICIYTLID